VRVDYSSGDRGKGLSTRSNRKKSERQKKKGSKNFWSSTRDEVDTQHTSVLTIRVKARLRAGKGGRDNPTTLGRSQKKEDDLHVLGERVSEGSVKRR